MWRPFNNGAYYSYAGNGGPQISIPSGPVTFSCWARFNTNVTHSDEWVCGIGNSGSSLNFARRGSDGMLYCHAAQGSHSFLNYTTIGAQPTVWYHLFAMWNRPATFDHKMALNGSVTGTGTTLQWTGGPMYALFSYDSFIDMAHVAVWDVAFSDAEMGAYWWRDPLTVKPESLRAYWPLSRGMGLRQCAPRQVPGVSDALYSSVSGTRAILDDDPGPPIAALWPRLDGPSLDMLAGTLSYARLTQLAVEVLYRPTSDARLTQLAVEALVGPVSADTDFIPYAEIM